jgi:hypothetical protein
LRIFLARFHWPFDSEVKTRFNYLFFVDLIVLVCIVIVAGRPDGLAITFSAIIVAMLALLYRCTVKVKSYVSIKSRRKAPSIPSREDDPRPPVSTLAETRAGRGSWLRDGD